MVKLPTQPIECQNYIAGQWSSGSGNPFEIFSPYTGKVIGRARASTQSDVDRAVQAAKKAQVVWGKTPLKERCQVLLQARQTFLRDLDTLSHSVSSESGKTLAEARAGLLKGVEVLEFALSLQNMDHGGKLEVSRGVFCEYRREPLGVVAGITPFNFPAMVPMWMIPIAIALGNAFLWKPSDKTPLTSLLLAKSFKDAGLPDGILTLVQGGRETVESILDHPQVTAVGFVGSTPVARSVYQRGSQAGKRVLALGGAKNHIILMPDADVEMASRGIADSFTGCAGQRCMAASVLIAVGDTEHIVQEVLKKSQSMQIGTDMGAIITRESRDRIVSAIGRAQDRGAKILLDGRAPKVSAEYQGGNWLGPTLLDHVQAGSEAATDELFGPVLSIVRVKTLSEALEIQNSSHYGNAASVFTQSGAIAERVAQEATAGMIGINIGVPVPREPFSFGGTNESRFGHGDITGESSLDFWSQLKKVTTKWAPAKDHNWMS